MMWTRAKIIGQRDAWGQCVEYSAQIISDDTISVHGHQPPSPQAPLRALAYLPQVGPCHIGDEVLLSTATDRRGLGTGGFSMIVANNTRLPADPPDTPGHIVKARYTPMQVMVLGVDEQESTHHELLREANSITGMPVICADLHSALPAIVAGIRHSNPQARIAYVMSDGGALPAWFSKVAHTLTHTGHILGTISAGQAYGGQLEAVNIYTALLAARLVWHADITIVAQGPGNLGTDTRWGFSGTTIGEALNAVAILAGKAIACVRASDGDHRYRHRGISHHTMRILTDIVHMPCAVPLPIAPTLVH